MSVFRSSQLRDNNLEKRPRFYTSFGGADPYVARIKSGDARQGHLKVVKKITFEGKTTVIGGVGQFTQTITHNFGKYTYPIGDLNLGGDHFPIPFVGRSGASIVTSYTSITKNALTILISSALLGANVSVDAVVYLLRETL